jgi:hypothetical protein
MHQLGTILMMANGWLVRATPHVVQVYEDEVSTHPITYDLQTIIGVRRDGQVVSLRSTDDQTTTIKMASLDDAGELELIVRGAIQARGRIVEGVHPPGYHNRPMQLFPTHWTWQLRVIVSVLAVTAVVAVLVWAVMEG